jgi:hypothetical protein
MGVRVLGNGKCAHLGYGTSLESTSRLARRSPWEYLVYFHNIEQMQLWLLCWVSSITSDIWFFGPWATLLLALNYQGRHGFKWLGLVLEVHISHHISMYQGYRALNSHLLRRTSLHHETPDPDQSLYQPVPRRNTINIRSSLSTLHSSQLLSHFRIPVTYYKSTTLVPEYQDRPITVTSDFDLEWLKGRSVVIKEAPFHSWSIFSTGLSNTKSKWFGESICKAFVEAGLIPVSKVRDSNCCWYILTKGLIS